MTVIKKLEITSFGRFKDKTVEFTDGLNGICMPNESGKSTVADFILFMLYGFDYSGGKNVSPDNNLHRKYLPWNGEGLLAGAMELDADGKPLRIERTHNAGRKKTVTVRDGTGAELAMDGAPGEELFGVDRDTFLRTFLIRQTDVKFSDTAGLARALKNLVTTGDEDTSYEAAAAILHKKRLKFRSREKNSGRIFDLRKEITELELAVNADGQRLAAFDGIADRRAELTAQLAEAEQNCEALNAELPLARAGDARRRLAEAAKIRAQLDTLSTAGRELPRADELERMSRAFYDRDRAARDCEQAVARLDGAINAERDALSACPDYDSVKINEAEYARIAGLRDKPNIILTVIGAALAAAGVALAFAVPAAGIPLAALGLIGVIAGLIVKRKAPGGFGKSREELLSAFESYKANGARIEAARAERQSAEALLDSAKSARDSAAGEAAGYTAKYGVASPEEVTRLAAEAADERAAGQRRQELERALASFPPEEELEKIAAAGDSEQTESEVNGRLIAAMARRSALGDRLNELKARAAERDAIERRLFERRQRLSELSQELKDGERQARILMSAEDALEQAYNNLSNRFSPIVNEAAGAPLSVLTDGKYSEVTLDRDFNIRVKAEGAMRELGYFSRGTADAVYFSYRFAMCDLVGDKKGLPMILDDPFWSLDGERLANALEFMQKAAADRQIILFSAR